MNEFDHVVMRGGVCCEDASSFYIFLRYICILHPEHYNKLFGVKGTLICVILLWSCVILMDIPNWSFLGVGSHGFFELGLHCAFEITSNFVYNTIMYTGLAVLFPALVIFFCYFRILRQASGKLIFLQTQQF